MGSVLACIRGAFNENCSIYIVKNSSADQVKTPIDDHQYVQMRQKLMGPCASSCNQPQRPPEPLLLSCARQDGRLFLIATEGPRPAAPGRSAAALRVEAREALSSQTLRTRLGKQRLLQCPESCCASFSKILFP